MANKQKQMLAVWGSPGGGKTVTAVKLALELSKRKKNVVLVFTDVTAPTLPAVVSEKKLPDVSVGELLAAPGMTQEQVLKTCVPCEKNPYISFLGYKAGENVFTHAEYSKEKAVDMLVLLRHIADYVIVDCTSLLTGNVLATTALEVADDVLRVCSCDLKAISYFSSYDNQAGGSLRKTMTSLTHKNLPLAMFLEYADMGFPAYTGATNKTCSNDTIITYLGMGIVWFTDPPEQPEPTDYDYEYRVDTDVITPVTLYAGSEINPDSPATVSFTINGSTYRMNNIVIPSGDSQIAWVKWHTPSEPQDITIYVSTNKGSLSQSTIQAKVVDLSGNDPPDPKATDTMGSWTASSVPSRETKTYAAWSVWWARWHPYWVWHSTGDDDGYWVDEGWYDFFRDNYSASMTATTRIEPDEKVPTASGDLMKSGYGVTNTVTATVSTSAPLSHYTYGQTAVSYFPEFGYGTYWRLLERLTSGTTARFQFAKNIYSTYNQRVHFSPVWFPDGSYTVNTHVIDIWTPAGMLAMNLTDDVTISGSLYDDWHIAPGNP